MLIRDNANEMINNYNLNFTLCALLVLVHAQIQKKIPVGWRWGRGGEFLIYICVCEGFLGKFLVNAFCFFSKILNPPCISR